MLRASLPFALALFSWSSRAHSQTEHAANSVTFEWSAPSGCPTRAVVLDRVTAILGHPASRENVAVRAIAELAPSGRWRIHVDLDGRAEGGHREFEAESCDAAADATALIVALTIDSARSDEASSTPAPPVSAEVPARSSPHAEARASPSDSIDASKRSAPTLLARAAFGGDAGTLARPIVGGELGIALSLKSVRVELAGSAWTSATAAPSERPQEGATMDLVTVGVRGSYLFDVRDWTLAPLAGIEVDRVSAAGFGGVRQFRKTAVWPAIDFGGTLSWSFRRRLGLSLTTELALPMARPRFVALEPSPAPDLLVQQTSPIALRFFLGIGYSIF